MELCFHTCLFFKIIVLFLILLTNTYVEANEYDDCKSSFLCGSVSLSYPFYDGDIRPEFCGYPGFRVECKDGNNFPEISLAATSSVKYYLLHMDADSHTVSVAREDLWSTYCLETEDLYNTTLNFALYRYPSNVENVTLYYDCRSLSPFPNLLFQFRCQNRENPGLAILNPTNNYPIISCTSNIIVPVVNQSAAVDINDSTSFQRVIRYGFDLEWSANNNLCDDCRRSSGECGYNKSTSSFICYRNGSSNQRYKLKITLLVIASSVVGLTVITVALLYFKRRMGFQKLNFQFKKERKNSKDVEAVLKRYGDNAPKRYTYKEIKKMTSCFKEKLGEGGYGAVYKGKLQNGSSIAVKLLKDTNCDGTEFTNEVASISETNHVNVVTLLGYCFQGSNRALVFDFMPNGSLDKYIYSGKAQNPLSWETLLQIAIGIGRGLEYLHKGCRTRILHFDIKPHNILLDAKYCPKISDFGLAKKCLETKSLVTMSVARGTPGYIAPEVFCRGFGGASHKSDVYSYGMLVLDLVGCRKNGVSVSEKTGSEMYFPNWIYKQFELEEDQELLGIANDEEKLLQRKLVIASLWCIQTHPSNRPSISKVLEMLEEDLESLQIPPMPFLSSPTKPYSQNPSTCTMTL